MSDTQKKTLAVTRKKRILVFPCGSEIGLEIHRSMRHSTHFELIGASSIDDHGRFVYENYISDLPFHTNDKFSDKLKKIIQENKIDAIYPTMDAVAETLQNLALQLNIRVIGSSKQTTAICASKNKTYSALDSLIPTPKIFQNISEIEHFPIFIKPDRGYGARGAAKVDSTESAKRILTNTGNQRMLLLEYLPGKEWTVDCFSDRHGKLRFHGVRGRNRVSNGISVNTKPCNEFAEEFAKWAATINKVLKPRGAWFFQAKMDSTGKPKLLEVAARLAGSSGLFRMLGVNFALLSTFDAFDQDVDILLNDFPVEMDRALDSRYKIDIDYTHIFVDLDDCLIVDEKVNHQLIGFLYKAIGQGKHISLITRHTGNLEEILERKRLKQIFDRVIHIKDDTPKSNYIDTKKSIFIDDSYRERLDLINTLCIQVFSPDMIENII